MDRIDRPTATPPGAGHAFARPDGGFRLPGLRERPGFWLLYVAFWCAIGLLLGVGQHAQTPGDGWGAALLLGLSDAATWAPLPLVCLAVARRVPLAGRPPLHTAAWLVGCAMLLAAARLSLLFLLEVAEGQGNPSTWISLLPTNLYFVLMFIGEAYAVEYFVRSRARDLLRTELETRLAQVQLQALQAQLHPHFLFNALNSVSALMRRDAATADGILTRLGELLRLVLQRSDRQVVALREEIDLILLYLEIQRARYGERLRVDVRVAPAAREAPVPHLVLQPLVENAIRHGIAPLAGGGAVSVSAEPLPGGVLRLEVEDTGVGLPEGWGWERAGVGLSNLRARLEQLYGAGHALRIGRVGERGTRVTLEFPALPSGARENGVGSGEALPPVHSG